MAFVTRRTSPHVKAKDDAVVMTWPETLFRAAVAVEVLAIALVLLSLFWDAPLEELADPMQTPNPAKAPWYFLGLQELLHYFPPVIAGVLIPTMVVLGAGRDPLLQHQRRGRRRMAEEQAAAVAHSGHCGFRA